MNSRNSNKRIVIIMVFFIFLCLLSVLHFKVDFQIGDRHYYIGISNYIAMDKFKDIEYDDAPFTINSPLTDYNLYYDNISVNGDESNAYLHIDELYLDGGLNFFYIQPYEEKVKSIKCVECYDSEEYISDYLKEYNDIENLYISSGYKENMFEKMDNLKVLTLEGVVLNELNIMNLESLETLNLQYDNFYSINDIIGVERVNKIDLSYNYIMQIDPISDNNIKVMNLSYNDISVIENLESYPELEKIDLTGNEITRITQDSYDYIIDNDIEVIGVDINNIKIENEDI